MNRNEHSHPHPHEHHHIEDSSDIKQTRALLAYMVEHNEHHAEELAGLLDSLPKSISQKLLTAIGAFEVANVDLQMVLEDLDSLIEKDGEEDAT